MTYLCSTRKQRNRAHSARAAQVSLPLERSVCVHSPSHSLTLPFEKFLASETGHSLHRLLTRFPHEWRPYVLGGVLRDLRLRSSGQIQVPDVDLVIEGCPSQGDLRARLPQSAISNSFGGLKCYLGPNGTAFDIWRVEDHLAAGQGPAPTSIQSVLPHCVTGLDAVALDVRQGTLFELGFLEGIAERNIFIVGHSRPVLGRAAAQAAHLVLLIRKYSGSFEVDQDVWLLLAHAIALETPDAIRTLLVKKFFARGGHALPRYLRECNEVIAHAQALGARQV